MNKKSKWQNKESSAFDGFKEQKSILSYVKVNVVLCFISDVWSEISTNKAVPISIVFTIELIFQVSCHLLGCVHFLKGVFSSG